MRSNLLPRWMKVRSSIVAIVVTFGITNFAQLPARGPLPLGSRGVSYTLQIPAPARVTPGDVARAFPKVKSRTLFTDVERAGLARLNHAALGDTLLIGPVAEVEAKFFEERFAEKFPTLNLERNEAISFSRAGSASIVDPRNEPAIPGSDPLRPQQWALKNTAQEVRVDLDDLRTEKLNSIVGEDVRLPAPAQVQNLKEITVAVLDTGLDVQHEDLRANLKTKTAECEALVAFLTCKTRLSADADAETKCLAEVGDIDRDRNGYPMDCVGWSVTSSLSLDPKSPLSKVLGSPDMDDLLGHGTHVSGIVAAVRDNGVGVSGVATNVKILPVRVIDSPPVQPIRPQNVAGPNDLPDPNEEKLGLGTSSVELIARGFLYAVLENVNVINMSLGWPATLNSRIMADLVRIARERNIAVIAAAGNDSTDSLTLPCSFPGVICVGAHGPDGLRAKYSNRGPGVDLLAPGTSILSSYPIALRARFFTDLQGYEFMSGTSMAAPMVSGAMATLLGKGYSIDESLARMLSSARVTGDAIGQNRRLDLAAALARAPQPFLHVTERAPVRIVWKKIGDRLEGAFHVKNLWTDAKDCSLSYHLVPADNTISSARLNRSLTVSAPNADCGAWKAGEEREFRFTLDVKDLRANRDFILETDTLVHGASGTAYAQILQTGVQIAPTPDVSVEALAVDTSIVEGAPVGGGNSIRTVSTTDARTVFAKPEYVVISRTGESEVSFQLLSQRRTPNYVYSKPAKLTDLSWEFLVAQRFWSEEAQATRMVLIYRKRDETTLVTKIRFVTYDENLDAEIRTVEYDGANAPIGENFRWTTYGGKDAMLFIADGNEPPSEDRWTPVPDKTVTLRCYVLDSDAKLHWIQVDRNDPDTRIVDILPYRAEDTDHAGEHALLVIRGQGFRLDYFIGHFRAGKIVSLVPFTITPYRNMGSLKSAPLLSEEGFLSGNVLSSGTGRGRMRSTVLLRSGYDTIENDDFRFEPLSALDGVANILGGYRLGNRKSFFAQTNWDLQFHEFTFAAAKSGGDSEATARDAEVVRTTMSRFSFLPKLISQRAFFPILVHDGDRAEPAVLAADFATGAFSLSTIVPERDANGRVIGLARPAILSFETSEQGCSFIGNPTWDAPAKTFRMSSMCGSAIRSMAFGIPAER